MRLRALPVVAAAALSIWACGSSAPSDASGGAAAPPEPTADATVALPSATDAPLEPSPSASPVPAPTTVASAAESVIELRAVSLNVLHGLPLPGSCAQDSDACNAPTRLQLLWEAIESARCPEVIALQEIGPRQRELIPELLPELCDGAYTLLFSDQQIADQEMILTMLPVRDDSFVDLSGLPWTAHWALLDAGGIDVAVFATHYASSALNPPCMSGDAFADCSDVCPEGIETGSCNALETLEFLDAARDEAVVELVLGDLNKPLDDPRIALLTDAGFVDTWIAAGNAECNPETGEGCTCCVNGDSALDGLDEADQSFGSRIDFVLARLADGCELTLDTSDDRDADGVGTGLFAVGPVDPTRDGLVWFSDHHGVQADIEVVCR